MYDGRGNRTEKAGLKFFWYGLGSQVLDESDTTGNISDEYVYLGSQRVAHILASGGSVDFYGQDHLGSSRVMVAAGATSPCYDADFYPFGGERAYTTTCSQNYKFQGKERDPESGNDEFGARYYSFAQGRWLSPDWSAIPAPVPFANLTNPQTLNLYAMVRDNPESFTDLDGHNLSGAQNGEQDLSFWYDYTYTSPDTIYVPPSLVSDNSDGYFASTASDNSGDSSPNTASPQDSSAQNNQQTRDDIAKDAEKHKGSTDWAYDKKKGPFGCNTWKCNQFVGDVVKEAGAPAEVNGRYPTAGEWADKKTNIDNWRVLGPDEKPQAGDVAAYKIQGCHGCTGHSGIVVGVDDQGVHAVAAHYDVIGPDEKFQPSNPALVYRRYTGDDQ